MTQEEFDAVPWSLFRAQIRMKHRVVFRPHREGFTGKEELDLYNFKVKMSGKEDRHPMLWMDRDCAMERSIETAFAMGLHHRLGQDSTLRVCSPDVLRVIARCL